VFLSIGEVGSINPYDVNRIIINIINGLSEVWSLEISAKNGTIEVAFRKILARLGKG